MNALHARLSVFERADRPNGRKADTTLGAVLAAVASDKYAEAVAAVRAETDLDRRKALKLRLPAAAPSGRFSSRRAEGLEEHSGIVVVDLDGAPDLDALRADVNARPYVAGSFVSPSGAGLKPHVPAALVDPETGEIRAARDDAEHKILYDAVAALFETGASAGLVDPSGKDVARACYLSHDAEAYANPDAETVLVELPSEPPAGETTARSKTRSTDKVPLTLGEIEELHDHLAPPAPADDYDYWIRAWSNLQAFALENGHTADDARAIMERWSPARSASDYPTDNRKLSKGTAGAYVNLLKDAGLDYKRWLRDRYRRLRSDAEKPSEDAPRAGSEDAPRAPVLDIRSGAAWMEAASQLAEPRPLWGPLWFEGETTILFSESNAGKSVQAVQIAQAIASGQSLPGFPTAAEPQPVLYLDFEQSAKQWERRYSRDFTDPFRFSPGFHRAEVDPDVLADEDAFDVAIREAIEAAVAERGYRVVIVDNLTFLSRQSQEAKDALPLMRALHRLKRKYGLSLLVLGHTPKRDGSRPLTLNDLGGSRHLANFADAVVGLGRSARDADVRYLKQLKVRSAETEYHGEHVATLRLEKPGNFLGFTLLGYGPESEHLKERTDDERAQRDAAILDLHAEGKSYREIAAQLAISKNTVQKVVQAAAVPVPPGVPVSPLSGTGTGTAYETEDLAVPVPGKGTGRDSRGTPGDGLATEPPDLAEPWDDEAPY